MHNTFSIASMTVKDRRIFLITQRLLTNLCYSKKHHNQNSEKKNLSYLLPTGHVKKRLLKLFFFFCSIIIQGRKKSILICCATECMVHGSIHVWRLECGWIYPRSFVIWRKKENQHHPHFPEQRSFYRF